MTTNYFSTCKTLDEAKQMFWQLAKIHHPDKGGNTATFQEILNQFHAFKPSKEKFTGEYQNFNSAEYSHIIVQIVHIPEIKIEICGSWIWISGNTKPYKDVIKKVETGKTYKVGFSGKKAMWYFSPSGYKKSSARVLNIDEIRNLYGSKEVKKEEKEKVA